MENTLLPALNAQLNREVSTFLRYLLQAAAIKGAPMEPVRQMYLGEVKDEVEHAQFLAQQIAGLGGTPTLAPDLSPPPSGVEAMLRRDIAAEEADVKSYLELARLAEERNLVGLRMAMEEQAADEDRHRMEMERLLG